MLAAHTWRCVCKIDTARGAAGIYTRGWAVPSSISFPSACLHVYLCAKSRRCSSITMPTTKPHGRKAAALHNPPSYNDGCFAGALGYGAARDSLISVTTRISPHFPAAAGDPVYLLSASCSSARGWDAVSAGAWESGALICRCVGRKGQDLKQNRLAEKTACWIMLIKLCSAMENPFYFFGPKYERIELFALKLRWVHASVPWEAGELCFTVRLYLLQMLRKILIPLRLHFFTSFCLCQRLPGLPCWNLQCPQTVNEVSVAPS